VTVGLAVTLDPVVALRPVAGNHVYDVPPLAVNVAELPGQMVAELTDRATAPLTVTVVVLGVLEQLPIEYVQV
jgi:hypothetical protein